MIHLERADLRRSLFNDVVFLMFAEPGAMPEGGALRFVTRDGSLYGFNYLYDNIDLDAFLRYFPLLGQCRFDAFGQNVTLPAGWHYMYLGVGRHLIIDESVYPEFQEQCLDCQTVYEVAQQWWIIARRILKFE